MKSPFLSRDNLQNPFVYSYPKSVHKAKRAKGLFLSNEICQGDQKGRIFGSAGRGMLT